MTSIKDHTLCHWNGVTLREFYQTFNNSVYSNCKHEKGGGGVGVTTLKVKYLNLQKQMGLVCMILLCHGYNCNIKIKTH